MQLLATGAFLNGIAAYFSGNVPDVDWPNMAGLSDNLPVLIVALGIFAGSFVAGFAGFGLAAAAGAFLLHVLPAADAVPLMMLCSVVAQTAGLIVLRNSIALDGSLMFVVGGLLGVPIAVILVGILDPDWLRVGFGAFLALYAMQALALPVLRPLVVAGASGDDGPRQHSPPAIRILVGFIGGLVGGLTAMPGAALSVWADIKGGDKMVRRATVQPFILVTQLCALALLATDGRLLRPEVVTLFLVASPALALGTMLGLAMFGRVDSTRFRSTVLVLVFLSGAAMLA